MELVPKPVHSKIGASSYYRWKACPGSVKMCEGVPNKESSYAAEGTLAHDIASKILEDYFFQKGRPSIPVGYKPSDLDAIKTYVAYIKEIALRARSNPSKGEVLIEHAFDLSSVHPGLYGTADAVIYSPEESKLYVVDYKHGAGILVDVDHNEQLMYYALGALLSTGFPCDLVELTIVQPRCESSAETIRHWAFKSVELIDFAVQLGEDAAETEKVGAELNPGDHCRFCPAAATKCPAIQNRANQMAKMEFSKELSYDPKSLALALSSIPGIEAWVKNVREFAYQEALLGNNIPGYKLVEKRATRRWKDEAETTLELLQLMKPELNYFEDPSLKSPAQVEKMLPKNFKKDLEALTIKESSGFKLAHESEGGTPAKPDAVAEFKKVGEPNDK